MSDTETSVAEAPTPFTIAGKSFNFTPRYNAGHALTAGEASALNQTLVENVRNNLAAKAKKGEDLTQADVDAYTTSYEFGVRRVSAPKVRQDPVEAEALRIAGERIKAALLAKGSTVKAADVKTMALAIMSSVEGDKHFETAKSFRKLAQKRMAEVSKLSMDDLPDLPAASPAETEEAAAA